MTFPFPAIQCDPVAPFHDRPHEHMTREQRDAIVNRPFDFGPMARTRDMIERSLAAREARRAKREEEPEGPATVFAPSTKPTAKKRVNVRRGR